MPSARCSELTSCSPSRNSSMMRMRCGCDRTPKNSASSFVTKARCGIRSQPTGCHVQIFEYYEVYACGKWLSRPSCGKVGGSGEMGAGDGSLAVSALGFNAPGRAGVCFGRTIKLSRGGGDERQRRMEKLQPPSSAAAPGSACLCRATAHTDTPTTQAARPVPGTRRPP